MDQTQILQNPNEEWDILNELEDGQFGTVYKAKHKTKGVLASLIKVQLHEEDNPEVLGKELKNSIKLNHENIATILSYHYLEEGLWLFIEYFSECSLKFVMTALNQPFSEIQITFICKSLCKALAYIHSFNLAHCGIKSDTLVLTAEGRVVLTGLEVSTLNKIAHKKKGTFTGSPYWLPPELILSESFVELKSTINSDIWSFGITQLELAQMFPPYYKMSHLKVMQKIRKSDPPKLKYPSKFNESFISFLARCLAKDPFNRTSAKDLLSHTFLDCCFNESPLKDLYYEVLTLHNEEILRCNDNETENHQQENKRNSELRRSRFHIRTTTLHE